MKTIDVDIPAPRFYRIGTFNSMSPEMMFDMFEYCSGSVTSAVWPSANLAIFLPFEVRSPIVVTQLFSANGTAVSGNIDMGLYDIDGNRLVSIGTTAQAGTSAPQLYDITDTALKPGNYYIAVALNNIVGTLNRFSTGSLQTQRVAGIREMASAFVLPNPATFANPSAMGSYVPVVGAVVRGVI